MDWPRADLCGEIHGWSQAANAGGWFSRKLGGWFWLALKALADRENFVGQSVMSRLLRAVPHGEMLLQFGSEILSFGIRDLPSHSAAQVFNARGEPCGVYDFDVSSTVIRQRGLPEGEDLPEPMRRAVLAEAGHSGCQRGEVQVNAGYLQHAATGLWVQMSLMMRGHCSPLHYRISRPDWVGLN